MVATDYREPEDITPGFNLIGDKKTPFLDNLPRGAAPEAGLYEWACEIDPAPVDEGWAYDGQEVQDSDFAHNAANRVTVQGRTGEQRHSIATGQKTQGRAQIGIPAGKAYDHELFIGMRVLKKKVEKALVGTQDSVAEVKGTTPSKPRGLDNFLRTANPSGSPDLPLNSKLFLPAAQKIVRATALLVTLADLKAAGRSIFDTLGLTDQTWTCYCSALMKDRVTDYMVTPVTGAYPTMTWEGEATDTMIQHVVMMVVTDWGTFEFKPHSFLDSGTHIIGVEASGGVKLRPVRGVSHQPLPKGAGGPKGVISTEYGLEVHPLRHFKAVAA